MDSVLATLGAFNAQTEAVFDRIDAACDSADAQLEALEERLTQAVQRVEASRGSTRPLVVCSARTFGGQQGALVGGRERVFDEGALAALVAAAPLPNGAAAGAAEPAVRATVEGLARVVQCVASAQRAGAPARQAGARNRLLAPGGRLASMPELFLFNAREQPYSGRHGVDNLAGPCEEEPPTAAPAGAARRRGGEGAALHLDDDEPDPLLEDLRFRPGRASEVCFDLPDSLPDLGGPVANILWRQQDQVVAETERPAWDAPGEIFRQINSSSSRQAQPQVARQASSASSGPSAPQAGLAPAPTGPPATSSRGGADPDAPVLDPPVLFQPPARPAASSKPAGPGKGAPPPPPPPPAAAAKAKAAAKPAPETAATAKGAPPPPPPPAKVKGKGKGKGPGKGQAPKPPPPKPKAADAQPAPPPSSKPPADVGGGKAAMFAAITKGTTLRKVGAPKERSGALVGKVRS